MHFLVETVSMNVLNTESICAYASVFENTVIFLYLYVYLSRMEKTKEHVNKKARKESHQLMLHHLEYVLFIFVCLAYSIVPGI